MAESASQPEESVTGKKGGQPRRIPIDVMEPFDHDRFVQEYKSQDKPVVIKGGALTWSAVAKWSPAYFAEHFGDKRVIPSVNLPDTEVPYQYIDVDFRQEMTVAEFVERMNSGERCYIDQVLTGFFDGINEDFRFEDFQAPDIKALIFWLGSNTRSGLHYDYVDNFFAQICGSKLAIIAAPEEVRNLHVFPDSHTKSQVSPEHPDLAAHPRLGLATLQQANLETGDVLYLPRGWWHYFASSPNSISLACWHGVPLMPADDAKFVFNHRLWNVMGRSVRDFIWNGMLKHPYKRRLYSLPPTGVMLHELVSKTLLKKHG
jgi:lysine-specific demethylase 8